MRFCYVPPLPEARTPRRYACQPEAAASALAEAMVAASGAALTLQERQAIREEAEAATAARVRPRFTSLEYGTAGYCQLACGCPDAVVRGADDEAELGAFHDLFQPQRAANLRARLDEYTPAGMEAGSIYAS